MFELKLYPGKNTGGHFVDVALNHSFYILLLAGVVLKPYTCLKYSQQKQTQQFKIQQKKTS